MNDTNTNCKNINGCDSCNYCKNLKMTEYNKYMYKTKEEIREKGASIIHDVWSHWQNYLHSKGKTISDENWERWERQLRTSYNLLSEEEKESDRKIFDKFYADFIHQIRQDDLEEVKKIIKEKGLHLGYKNDILETLNTKITRFDKRVISMREFKTGATRDIDDNKPDYEGFLCPLVIESFGKYMHQHRIQNDGKIRDSDNWQKGIPSDAYMKSLFRHFHKAWMIHRGYVARDEKGCIVDMEKELNAIIFNTQGLLRNLLLEKLSTDK